MERNVLVIAYYFPPMGLSGVQRISKFVKYLPSYGWNPIVLTSHLDSYYAFDEELLAELNETTIYRTHYKGSNQKIKVKSFPGWFKQKIGRAVLQTLYVPDSKIKWKSHAIKAANEIFSNHQIHAIFSTAPPYTDFLIAEELAGTFKKPYIIDYRDPWVNNPFHFYPTPYHKGRNIKMETRILKSARKVIVLTRTAKEQMLMRYRFLSHDDIIIIPHGYDPEDFSQIEQNHSEKFIITHSGVFQDDRTPKYFLEALAAFLKKNPALRSQTECKFIGLMRKNHLKMIAKLGLDDVTTVTGYINHAQAVSEIANSSLLWLMVKDTVRTPGKLYEYIATGKPIIFSAPEGSIQKAVTDYSDIYFTSPNDIKAIENAISDAYNRFLSKSQAKANVSFIEQFNRKKLTADLARELSLIAEI